MTDIGAQKTTYRELFNFENSSEEEEEFVMSLHPCLPSMERL